MTEEMVRNELGGGAGGLFSGEFFIFIITCFDLFCFVLFCFVLFCFVLFCLFIFYFRFFILLRAPLLLHPKNSPSICSFHWIRNLYL